MTSGQHSQVPLSSIIINRAERQRRVLDEQHITTLANSIRQRGLIHAPVIQRNGELVVGECRLEACKRLGWTNIAVQYIDELDPTHLRAVELEENIRRKAIEWKEECLAFKELHDMHRAEDPSWSIEDTGKSLGMSTTQTADRIAVARELLSGKNPLIAAAPRFTTANGILARANERAKTAATVALTEAINPPTEASPIITADFREWAKTYTGPKFNFIHCDFPYGIGADKFIQGAAPTHGGYEDSEATYWKLVETLFNYGPRIFAGSCHIMFWFSMHYYEDTKRKLQDFVSPLEEAGFVIDPFPLIWLKSDNVGIIPDPQRGPRRIYETAFFGSRGDRKIVSPVANAIGHASERSEHMSAKPDPMLRHFFRMFIDGSTVMLDPTCGSGSALRAAQGLGAKSFTGLEVNPEFADRARLSLKAAR